MLGGPLPRNCCAGDAGAARLVGGRRRSVPVYDGPAGGVPPTSTRSPEPAGLSRRDDPSGRVVAKQRVPAGTAAEPEREVHPGHDWFHVLDGTVRLVLGGREHIVAAGEAASFSTRTPHSVVGVGGPAEILSILDHHGERAHLDAS